MNNNQQQIINDLLNACFFLFDNERLLKAWNCKDEKDFKVNKLPILMHMLSVKNINIKYLALVPARLVELSYVPQMADIIRLAIPKHDYQVLFNQTLLDYQKYLDYSNSQEITQHVLNELNKISILSYNVALNMFKLKSINILSCSYDDCKLSFKEIFDKTDNLDIDKLEPLPKFSLKIEKSFTQDDKKIAQENLKKIKDMLKGINTFSYN